MLLRRVHQAHQLHAQRQAVVQFLHHRAAVVQFRLLQVAHVAPGTAVHDLHSLVQSAHLQVGLVAVQVLAPVACRVLRLVAVRSALVAQCVLLPRAVLVQAVLVRVRVAQVVVLLLVAVVLVVQVVRVLVQAHAQVVLALVALVVPVAVALVVRVVDNAVLLKRNHVHVVVKTSTKCCRKLQQVTQQAMQQCQRASSLLSAVRQPKNLLQN